MFMAEIPSSTFNKLDRLKYWTQKILPLVYDDSLSYYEVLGKVVNHLNLMCDKLNSMVDIESGVNNQIENIHKTIQELETVSETLTNEIEKVKKGDYVSLYLDSISNWIDKHLIDIIGRSASFIVFGLNNDGYFVAYVPESWDFISFDTEADYNNPNYGKLILEY